MQEDALPAGANVVVIDDLIATGGSAFAAHQLVDQAKAKVIQNLFVVDVRRFATRSLSRALDCALLDNISWDKRL